VIDRRTGLICVTLIALMLAAAVWRVIMVEDWTVLAVRHREAVPSWLPFFFPAASAFVVGRLYLSSARRSADVARVQRWRAWGAFLSISYCALLLLLQATIIVMSILGMHPYLWVIYRALGVLLGIAILVAVNQRPKLPSLPGGDLGPIYEQKYVRIKSRIAIVWLVGAIAVILASRPGMDWRPALFTLLAAAFLQLWSIAWRRSLVRKWNLEQRIARGR